MAWKKEPCPECGGPKSVISKMCRACLMQKSESPVCPSCGGRKTYSAKLCRSCQASEGRSFHPCIDCQARIQSSATRCRECYDKQRDLKRYYCADCGKPTKQYASTRYAERCRECDTKHRRYRDKKPCSVDGCLRIHQAKGFCMVHYQATYRKQSRGKGIGAIPRKLLALWPCQICGYARLSSAIHRLNPGAKGGAYVPGNMVALCANCHREVHAGVTAPPEAPDEAAILATNQTAST